MSEYRVNLIPYCDISMFHRVILEAIANNGKFGENYDDIFKLVKDANGVYVVEWA